MCFGHKQHIPKGSLSKKRYYKDAKMTYRTPGQVQQGTGSENSLCFSSPKRYALFFYKLVVFAFPREEMATHISQVCIFSIQDTSQMEPGISLHK